MPTDPDMREVGDFDLVAFNGQELVAVEVKTTLTKEKVRKSIEQLKKFREYFPGFRDRTHLRWCSLPL